MEFIFEKQNAIPLEFCDKMIEVYKENKESHYDGVTYSGLNEDIKKTRDLMINIDDDKFLDDIQYINDNLMTMLKEFLDRLYQDKSYEKDFTIIRDNLYLEKGMLIQRYEKNIGKFVYHNDWSHSQRDKSQRTITFIYYLNTVEEGGETEFFGGTTKIKPEKGKLVLFPATWTYPHRGNIPVSSEKYIITGWLYQHYDIPELKTIDEIVIYKLINQVVRSSHIYSLFTPTICEWILSKVEVTDITQITKTHPIFLFIVGNIQSVIYKLIETYKIPDGIIVDIQDIVILKDRNFDYNTLFYSRIPLSQPIKTVKVGNCIFSTDNIIIEEREGIDLFIVFTLKGFIKKDNKIMEIKMS